MAFTLESISKGKQIKAPRIIVLGVEKIGKALDINTEIPTPSGFRRLMDISKGDTVYSQTGLPTKVTGVTSVMLDRKCYDVEFHTGEHIIADADHQWSVISIKGNKKKVITTEQMFNEGVICYGDRYRYSVPLCNPVAGQGTMIVPPYTLGAWLGDGTSENGGITIFDDDADILTFIKNDGFDIGAPIGNDTGRCTTRTIKGLKVLLRKIGVLDNKHIPEEYLHASIQDRMALLRGLMDTDGHATKEGKGQVEFMSVDSTLAKNVLELCHSLGIKAKMSIGKATLNGRYISEKYRITFSTSIQVFQTSRKASTLKARTHKQKAQKNAIVSITPCPSYAVKCIAVDCPTHTYLATRQYIPTHNTTFACGSVFDGNKIVEHGSNSPIGIPIKGETGMDDLDIAKFPACQSFSDLLEAIGSLATSEHEYKTCVIDSASALGPLIYDDVCAEFKVNNVRKVSGFRTGEAAVQARWRQLLDSVDALREEKNMAVIIIGHIKIRKQKNPEGEDYDVYDFDLDNEVSELLKRWADLILFCNTKVVVRKEGEDSQFSKAKRKTSDPTNGQRFLYTQKRPAHPGGGRGVYGALPYELPLSWSAFEEAVAECVQ